MRRAYETVAKVAFTRGDTPLPLEVSDVLGSKFANRQCRSREGHWREGERESAKSKQRPSRAGKKSVLDRRPSRFRKDEDEER